MDEQRGEFGGASAIHVKVVDSHQDKDKNLKDISVYIKGCMACSLKILYQEVDKTVTAY